MAEPKSVYENPDVNDSGIDVTLALGEYEWKVHSQLLIEASPFFKAALEKDFKEAATGRIELHDDCPWIIGRILQYLYLGEWGMTSDGQVFCDHAQDDVKLHRFMDHTKTLPTYYEDEAIDQARDASDVVVALFNTADKYLMGDLIGDMHDSDAFEQEFGGAKEEEYNTLLNRLFKHVGIEKITMHPDFQKKLEGRVSSLPCLIYNEGIRQWFEQDPEFTLRILDKCCDTLHCCTKIIIQCDYDHIDEYWSEFGRRHPWPRPHW